MYNTFLCIFGKYWPSKHTKINSFPFWMGFATDNSHVPVMYSHKQIMFEIVLLYLLAIFPLSRYWNPLLQHTSYHHPCFRLYHLLGRIPLVQLQAYKPVSLYVTMDTCGYCFLLLCIISSCTQCICLFNILNWQVLQLLELWVVLVVPL